MKIVTSVYELNYEESRSGDIYKHFSLLTHTIRDIIFDEYEYVIYTDKKTYDKHHMSKVFNKPNIKIKFLELKSDFYVKTLNPIRTRIFNSQEIYDRLYTVKNYVEVILNKLKILELESEEDKNTVWIDSGLFGTSCHDGWRDYMVKISHTKNFLDKINEKINYYGFICLKGNGIHLNGIVKNNFRNLFNKNVQVIPGGLFGGNHDNIKNIFKNHHQVIESYIKTFNDIISEQEILHILTSDKNVKYYEFEDWLDFQKGILEIMDLLTNNYTRDKCYK